MNTIPPAELGVRKRESAPLHKKAGVSAIKAGAICLGMLSFAVLADVQLGFCEDSVLPFKTLRQGSGGHFPVRQDIEIITEPFPLQQIWEKKIKPYKVNEISFPTHELIPVPSVDFDQRMVLVVFYPGSSSGYEISITRIVAHADRLEVFVRRTAPSPRDAVFTAFTTAYHIVEMEKIKGARVVMVEEPAPTTGKSVPRPE